MLVVDVWLFASGRRDPIPNFRGSIHTDLLQNLLRARVTVRGQQLQHMFRELVKFLRMRGECRWSVPPLPSTRIFNFLSAVWLLTRTRSLFVCLSARRVSIDGNT